MEVYSALDSSFMASPAALARADLGLAYRTPAHILLLDNILVEAFAAEGSRTILCAPPQHGKTKTGTIYFAAWALLMDPSLRVVILGNSQEFAANNFGLPVREIIRRFGDGMGIRLSEDTRGKAEWLIEGSRWGAGVVCRGPDSGVAGKAADLFIIDDLIKNDADAMSPTTMDRHWEFYKSVVLGRMRKKTRVVIVQTRWHRRDVIGRILDSARRTRESWRVVKFRAIAEGDDDPLGRKPGEPLWPEEIPLKQLLVNRDSSRWWAANWQQEPEDEEGAFFHPNKTEKFPGWPRYTDTGDAYLLTDPSQTRRIWHKSDLLIFGACDWAFSTKKTADYTAVVIFGLTPDGKLLILDVVNERVRLEDLAPRLSRICREWRPHLFCVEAGHPTLANECRLYPDIPEIRWLTTQSRNKLARAFSAVVLGENGRIYLPDAAPTSEWQAGFIHQLTAFTGVDDEHDDMVDALSYGCAVAQQLRVNPRLRWESEGFGPAVLTGPRGII